VRIFLNILLLSAINGRCVVAGDAGFLGPVEAGQRALPAEAQGRRHAADRASRPGTHGGNIDLTHFCKFAARGTDVHNRWKGLRVDRSRWRRVQHSVVWKDSSLVFSIEEHEDGRILLSKETWSVIEDGATLERIRERPNGEKQTLFFRRIPVSTSDSKSDFIKANDK
jgi:hypothetical protein